MKCESFGCKNTSDKIGVLIAQLGTPDAPTAAALKPYLKQFLGDPRVIEKNRVLWWLILNLIILTTRPKKSAALYKRIWTENGSPLLAITAQQTDAVREQLHELHSSMVVEFGMRYGTPSLESAIDRLIDQGCSKILLFPMYPQYSATTTASTYDAVFSHLLKRRVVPTLRVAEPYFTHPSYIQALAGTIDEAYRNFDERPEALVLSYHGIPESYVEAGDTYCCQCTETTEALISAVKTLDRKEIIHTFQSRFGKDPWLVPYTDETIEELAKRGVKHIAVACPGFPADCLETLDEIGNEAEEEFLEYGGERLSLIPCLNAHPLWIESMAAIIKEELGSWLDTARRSGEQPCKITCPVKAAKAGKLELPEGHEKKNVANL
jgi:ferrochelatase